MSGWTTAGGLPNGNMNYAPTIFGLKVIENFYAETHLAETHNTDYEGQIKKFGDTVIVRTTPKISVADYVPGEDLDFENPNPQPVTMDINKGKRWAFELTTEQSKQFDLDAAGIWSADAAQQMRVAIETAVLAGEYAYAHASNKGTTAGAKTGSISLGSTAAPLAFTKDTVLEYIIRAGTALDEQNAPADGRWIYLPPQYVALLKLSDLKAAYIVGDNKVSPLVTGKIGMVDRFTVYMSNLLPTFTSDNAHASTHIIAGHKKAVSFATQLVENQVQPNPKGFGMLYKGLQVYGYQVVKPEALVDICGYLG